MVFGNSSSGKDISREVASAAKTVYFCGKHEELVNKSTVVGSKGNIYLKPDISRLGPKGEVWFQVRMHGVIFGTLSYPPQNQSSFNRIGLIQLIKCYVFFCFNGVCCLGWSVYLHI